VIINKKQWFIRYDKYLNANKDSTKCIKKRQYSTLQSNNPAPESKRDW